MSVARHDLGAAVLIKAEALGTPGKRTFRLVVQSERGVATIWLEKQQLSALALSIKGALQEIAKQKRKRKASAAPARTMAAQEPTYEFKAAGLGLTYDEETARLGILASSANDAKVDRATVVWWSPLEQAGRMAEEALEAAAGGRPICQICHQPIDAEGHMCTATNGHGTVKGHL